MSDSKRNKKSNNKKQDSKRPVILAKKEGSSREDKSSRKNQNEEKIQPKILIKVKEKESISSPAPITIATREHQEPSSSQSPSNVSIQSKEKDPVPSPAATTPEQSNQAPAQMSRPIPLISSALFQVNQNAQKLLMKSNTNFFVVGVIGTQGVGKSTIMNLLTCDDRNTDIYTQYFKNKEGVFATKYKAGKITAGPRTESVQMFIMKDRMVLLDCPPVLCNPFRKDATTSEIDDLKLLIFLLSSCHLVVVVQDDNFNLDFIRLIHMAEVCKPSQENKCFESDYFPNVLFVKNSANRTDFLTEEKAKREVLLKNCFAGSKLKIFMGQSDKQKKGKEHDNVKHVNCFLFPEVRDKSLTAYHPSLDLIVEDLRNRVFMTPRNSIASVNTDLTEGLWFDLITTIAANKNNFFLMTYEEIRRKYFHGGADQGSKGGAGGSALSFVDVD